MRFSLVFVLCVIFAAIGAGIDHYWEDAVFLLLPKNSETVEATKSSAPEEKRRGSASAIEGFAKRSGVTIVDWFQ